MKSRGREFYNIRLGESKLLRSWDTPVFRSSCSRSLILFIALGGPCYIEARMVGLMSPIYLALDAGITFDVRHCRNQTR
jgi:hypothetical protein